MGKILFYSELQEHAEWYFPDAYYSLDSVCGRWKFKWPNPEFPVSVAIHEDEIEKQKPPIRKWIERTDVGTVICEYVDKSYRVWYSKSRDWERTCMIDNRWVVFHFEDSETALAFSLRFNNLVRPITEDHPTRHHGERYRH